jgi:hypothetical protein
MKVAKILAAAALLVAGAAQAAGYTTFEYHQEELRSDNSTKDKFGIVVGTKTAGGQDYSIKLDTNQSSWGTGSVGSGVELRARQGFSVVGVNPYIGVRLGQKLATDESFSHYAADVGIKFPIVGALSGDVGARYRDAFQTANEFQSTRYHAMVSYAIDKNNSVGLRYSQAYGDSSEEKNAYRVTWTHNF